MLNHSMFTKVALSAVILAAATTTALAGGKWVREGNTAIVAGPMGNQKAVQLTKDPAIQYPDPDSYALIAYLPSGSAKSKLRLHEINRLSVAYVVHSGTTAGGSPRISIVLDVNRDGQYDSTNDEVVFVSLGSDPGGSDTVGDDIVSGNLTKQPGIWTTGSGSVVLGTFDEVLAQSKNGRSLAEGAVDSLFTIVDAAGDTSPLSIAVDDMQVNTARLNPKAKIKDVTDRSAQ